MLLKASNALWKDIWKNDFVHFFQLRHYNFFRYLEKQEN